jgi:hypothetical protein
MNYNALVVRAAKTFLQAFLASLSFGIAATSATTGYSAYRALIVAAIAAGVSAVMNLFLNPQTK